MTWEYIAGFIDGEGSIVRRNRVHNIYISQTNFEVLEEIRRFTGRGSVYRLTKRKNHWKDAWLYNAGGGRNTHYILTRIVGSLIVKKDLGMRVLMDLKARIGELDAVIKLKSARIKKAKLLRAKKWSYRKIAKELGTDFGYVRRLIVFSE